MDHETVTIPDTNTTTIDPTSKREILAKELSCSCGWTRRCQIPRAQSMAQCHLKFQHGGGRWTYAGSTETV